MMILPLRAHSGCLAITQNILVRRFRQCSHLAVLTEGIHHAVQPTYSSRYFTRPSLEGAKVAKHLQRYSMGENAVDNDTMPLLVRMYRQQT